MSVASARPRESLAGSTSLPAAGRFLLDLFDRFLIGRVRFRFADTEISSGTADGPETTLRIHDARVFARVVRFGNLGLGEAFMDGDFSVEEGELYTFLTACLRSRLDERLRHDARLGARALYHRARAVLGGTAASVRRHYDIGDDLFERIARVSSTGGPRAWLGLGLAAMLGVVWSFVTYLAGAGIATLVGQARIPSSSILRRSVER